MKIAFILTMPRNNAWNGRWSGQENLYAVVKSFRKEPVANNSGIAHKSFCYNFGDGWVASVECRVVEPAESKRIQKASRGFCGYEWMIDSILRNGSIMAK